MTITTFTSTGKAGTLTVSETVFGAPVNKKLLAQAIRVYIDHLHQGTSKVKTRSEVNMTTAKWYKQKGTGNARHGAKSAPIFVGGGVAHGPSGLRPAKLSLPPKLKQKALLSALSAQRDALVVTDELTKLTGKTKEAAALFSKISGQKDKVLVVLAEVNQELLRSIRNLKNVVAVQAHQVSAFDIVSATKIVLSTDAVKALEARFDEVKKVRVAAPVEAKKNTAVKPAVVKSAAIKAAKKETKKPASKKADTKVATHAKKVTKSSVGRSRSESGKATK